MNAIIDAAIDRSRTVIASLVLILIAGFVAYNAIPKDSDPDIDIPIIYVSMNHEGISPEDAVRLLVRPMEKEPKTPCITSPSIAASSGLTSRYK